MFVTKTDKRSNSKGELNVSTCVNTSDDFTNLLVTKSEDGGTAHLIVVLFTYIPVASIEEKEGADVEVVEGVAEVKGVKKLRLRL